MSPGNQQHESAIDVKSINDTLTLMEGMGVAAYTCDSEGRILNYNRASANLLGKDLVVGKKLNRGQLKIQNKYGNILRESEYPTAIAVKDGIAPEPMELILYSDGGAVHNLLAHATPTFNEARVINGAVAMLIDISGSKLKDYEALNKRAEEELRMTRRAIENAAEGIIIADATRDDHPIIFANHSFYNLTGYGPGEVLGKSCKFLQGPDTDAETVALLKQTLAEKRPFTGELINYKKDGTVFWNSLAITPILNQEGQITHYLGFQSDITERKITETKMATINESLETIVKERTAELEEVNKQLEAFSYTVSHDLQSPLRSIAGFSKILLNDYGDKLDSEGQHNLEVIEKNAIRMSVLIKSLLAFSKLGKAAINCSNVHMNEQVVQVINELKLSDDNFKAKIIQGYLGYAVCDPELMKQVWMNLLSNAVKYSSRLEVPIIEVGLADNKDEVIYFVKDNGAGFNIDQAEKLFQPFQRMHNDSEFEGTGIGLATVHRIITKHGGRIWVDARKNEGATFYFTLADSKTTL